eukprot:545570-Prymnesium_polylepis.1
MVEQLATGRHGSSTRFSQKWGCGQEGVDGVTAAAGVARSPNRPGGRAHPAGAPPRRRRRLR